jgi:hypothetical protein
MELMNICVDGLVYPKACEENIHRADPIHVREVKRTLRVLEIESWPKLAEKLLTEDAAEVVRVMCLYREAYLVCEELDEKLEVAYEEDDRLYLETRLRECEDTHHNYRNCLRGMIGMVD